MIDLLILTGPAGCSSAILPGLCEHGYVELSTENPAFNPGRLNRFVTEANSALELSAWAHALENSAVNATIVVLDCINPERRSYHNRDIPREAYDLRMITITYRIENSHAVAQQLSEYLEKSQ
jgi:hypothetical protein